MLINEILNKSYDKISKQASQDTDISAEYLENI
jgi:hypothetical protein